MNDSILIAGSVVGVIGLAAGIFIGKKIKQRDAKPLAGVPKNNFGWLMRDMSLALRRESCSGARRALTQATLAARSKKEQRALVKAYKKIQRCESRQIENNDE